MERLLNVVCWQGRKEEEKELLKYCEEVEVCFVKVVKKAKRTEKAAMTLKQVTDTILIMNNAQGLRAL